MAVAANRRDGLVSDGRNDQRVHPPPHVAHYTMFHAHDEEPGPQQQRCRAVNMGMVP